MVILRDKKIVHVFQNYFNNNNLCIVLQKFLLNFKICSNFYTHINLFLVPNVLRMVLRENKMPIFSSLHILNHGILENYVKRVNYDVGGHWSGTNIIVLLL